MTDFVLALDPGGTTGYALAAYSYDHPMYFVDGAQIPNGVQGLVDFLVKEFPLTNIYDSVRGLAPDFTIVSESFILDGRTKQPDLTPVRIEGALTALLGEGTVTYQRNTFKSLVGDEGLKRLGFWLPGQRHQNDARLHALAWAKLNHLPTAQAYWPEAED